MNLAQGAGGRDNCRDLQRGCGDKGTRKHTHAHTHAHGHTHTHTHTHTALLGSPPAGQDNELMVCSSGRNVGLLNLAV